MFVDILSARQSRSADGHSFMKVFMALLYMAGTSKFLTIVHADLVTCCVTTHKTDLPMNCFKYFML